MFDDLFESKLRVEWRILRDEGMYILGNYSQIIQTAFYNWLSKIIFLSKIFFGQFMKNNMFWFGEGGKKIQMWNIFPRLRLNPLLPFRWISIYNLRNILVLRFSLNFLKNISVNNIYSVTSISLTILIYAFLHLNAGIFSGLLCSTSFEVSVRKKTLSMRQGAYYFIL